MVDSYDKSLGLNRFELLIDWGEATLAESLVERFPLTLAPTPDEVDRCLEHLETELAALPRISLVVVLGRFCR